MTRQFPSHPLRHPPASPIHQKHIRPSPASSCAMCAARTAGTSRALCPIDNPCASVGNDSGNRMPCADGRLGTEPIASCPQMQQRMQRRPQIHYGVPAEQTTSTLIAPITTRYREYCKTVGASILHHWAPSLRRIASAVFSSWRGMRRAACNVQTSDSDNGGIAPWSVGHTPSTNNLPCRSHLHRFALSVRVCSPSSTKKQRPISFIP